jgi:hypothetical protein
LRRYAKYFLLALDDEGTARAIVDELLRFRGDRGDL